MSDGRHVAPFRHITLISSQPFFTLTPYIEIERRSVFHKLLMKTMEMITTYILDPINSVYNYVKYSVYFEILQYNGTNVSYTLDFQTITFHRLPWIRVTVLKLYYRLVAPFSYITLISNQPLFTLNP